MKNIVVGIDEVGRGPIAGPVTLCAVALHKKIPTKISKTFKDSKKLSAKQREGWFDLINALSEEGVLSYRVASVSAQVIDSKGISFAIRQAIRRTLKGIHAEPSTHRVKLDGGLRAPEEFVYQETIIKGDEKEVAIALASIVAKVTRDRYMIKQAKQYSVYGFEQHKGYGTRAHYQVLRKHGICSLHRVSFLKNITT